MDIDFIGLEIAITRAVVQQRIGSVQTPASRKPLPIHEAVARTLAIWRGKSMYQENEDFIFPSTRLNGEKPLRPEMVLRTLIRPALQRVFISNHIGWHTFRHSFATNLRSLGVDVKVAQELLRHANSRTTMDPTRKPSRRTNDSQTRVRRSFWFPRRPECDVVGC